MSKQLSTYKEWLKLFHKKDKANLISWEDPPSGLIPNCKYKQNSMKIRRNWESNKYRKKI